MPASVRAHASRATSSRPYDRRTPATSPESAHPSRNAPVSPTGTDVDAAATPGTDADGDADVLPDRPGLPTYAEYKRIESGYLLGLSPRKRDKALITQAMFDKIWDVLHQPEACTIDTPQFRFWVRKMFTLSRPSIGGGGGGGLGLGAGLGLRWDAQRKDGEGEEDDGDDDDDDDADLELERSMGIGAGRSAGDADALGVTAVVLHENRPVAIMEQLYELFCFCHVRAGHGGRDKTCAAIREHYSWVPKELTAQFVKACPTCALKRSGQCVDVGVLFGHRRAPVGRTRKRREAAAAAAALEVPEETSVKVGTPGMGWPTTGGPLDPENPEPCGVRERRREERRGGGDAGPARSSPELDSRMRPASRDAPFDGGVPRATTTFEFGSCDTPGRPFAEERLREGIMRRRLASTAGAESNESLEEHSAADPSGGTLGRDDAAAAAAATAQRLGGPQLRLLGGGVLSDAESVLAGATTTRPLQIDPVLLSFDYPGLGASGALAGDAAAAVHLGLSLSAGSEAYAFADHRSGPPLPALDPSCESDSPDSSFERALSLPYTPTTEDAAATLPLSLSTEFMGRSWCGSQYGYYGDGALLGMFYPCSGVEVGTEFDVPPSFSIMTDA